MLAGRVVFRCNRGYLAMGDAGFASRSFFVVRRIGVGS